MKRLEEQGAVVDTMKVKNCGVVRQLDTSAETPNPAARKVAKPRDKRRLKLKGKVARKPAKAVVAQHVAIPAPARAASAVAEASTSISTVDGALASATASTETSVAAATLAASAPAEVDEAATATAEATTASGAGHAAAVVVNRMEVDSDYDFDNVSHRIALGFWGCWLWRLAIERVSGAPWMTSRECDPQVSQLLHSEPIRCPLKEGFFFVNVVLFETRSPKPKMLPYLYDSRIPGHSLQHWLFVNRELKESYHVVEFVSDEN